MDGEFITILGGGLVFILAGVGYLVWKRKNEADAEKANVPARPNASKRTPKPKANDKSDQKDIKGALLKKLGVASEADEPAKTGPTKADLKELEGLILAGQIDEAARVAMRYQLWDKAAQLYLKVDQPGNAAHCAKRAGKFEMAAEFYEKAGEVESAMRMWEQSGHHDRARALGGREVDGPKGDGVVTIGKELKKEIDAALAKKDYMRAAELYEQAGDKENAAEQFAAFAQTARRPEVYADKIESLSPRVAYNLLRIATKGRPPSADSAELYRRVAKLQHHFGNRSAAIKTLQKLIRVYPEDTEAPQMLEEIEGEPDAVATPGNLNKADLAASRRKISRQMPKVTAPSKPPADEADEPDEPDEAVELARTGPSIADLANMIGDTPCDLSNIEVYYRLGLACLAAERPAEALKAFEAVDDASPGYRDTEARIARLQ